MADRAALPPPTAAPPSPPPPTAAPPGSAPLTAAPPTGPQQLSLSGRIDAGNFADYRRALHAAVDAGQGPLIVDVSGLELADASGLGLLLGAHRRAVRADRTLVLADPPPALARLLARTRLHRVLTLTASTAP